MALDLVKPEGAKTSPAYRLAKRGDKRADEPIERDWWHSGADNHFEAIETARCTDNDSFVEVYKRLKLDFLVRKTMATDLERRHHMWATVVEALIGATYYDARDYFRSSGKAKGVLRWLLRELEVYPKVDTIPFTALPDDDLEKHLNDREKYKHASDKFRASFKMLKSDLNKIPDFPTFDQLDLSGMDLAKKARYQWTLYYVKGWKFGVRRLRKVRKGARRQTIASSNATGTEIIEILDSNVTVVPPPAPRPISASNTSDKEVLSSSSDGQPDRSDTVASSSIEETSSPIKPLTPATSPAVDETSNKEDVAPPEDQHYGDDVDTSSLPTTEGVASLTTLKWVPVVAEIMNKENVAPQEEE